MPIIEAKGVTKVYRGDGVETWALRGVDFQVEAGEFTALVGPSGSGKSTLLHLLAGLDLPTEGEVWVGGVRLDRLSRAERARFRLGRVGLVFQAYNLLPVLTALENAGFILELRGVPRRVREEKALWALEALGLKDKAHRRPHQLSGGEQQRVAVARALAAEPLLVLADEPTANLDSQNGLALIERMKALNRERGVTFLFSTHDPRLLAHVGRVVRLEDGRIVGEERR
ncbi:ABC-type antimicrobial peptide transport system, ATPase component [Thermus oshimai JL-2]|uniref:ABC-type antimicrobial peptide transport system, ATPase component n=1 Tax=Thermus oshimai JL-2 TaxID=751945 RepID=K7R4Z8_THEOS|nr:ATP-binding cassette domain-containing protein [Thermus oshimai]AFV76019.1 ABC-type antimicrobial peptide transport system, ATPase component [Thermus oshimai JL-2]